MGCTPKVVNHPKTPTEDRLDKIGTAYNRANARLHRAPRSFQEIKPDLEGDASEDLLRSPNDGEPFVIIWRVEYNKLPSKGAAPYYRRLREARRRWQARRSPLPHPCHATQRRGIQESCLPSRSHAPDLSACEDTPPPAPPRNGEGSQKRFCSPSPLRGGGWGRGRFHKPLSGSRRSSASVTGFFSASSEVPVMILSSRKPRVHADRVAGGDRHHRHPHRPAAARRPESPRGRRPHADAPTTSSRSAWPSTTTTTPTTTSHRVGPGPERDASPSPTAIRLSTTSRTGDGATRFYPLSSRATCGDSPRGRKRS